MTHDPAALDAIWYGGRKPPAWMRCSEWVYRLGRPLHQRWQRLRSGHPGRPVVVVGNITAGGTGKTPLVIELVRRLTAEGLTAGVVSRGYGSAGRGLRTVTDDSAPDQVGDEPVLIRRATGAPVRVDSDRLNAAKALVADDSVDLILSDDGLQHRRLQRDLEIAVVDGERGLGNGRLLPAGPLREPAARLETVDFVVRNGGSDANMRLAGDVVVNLATGERRPLSAWAGREVSAVAGMGRPARFFAFLEAAGLVVRGHALPDHHVYLDHDPVLTLAGDVLTTSKDAVKLRGRALGNWWELPVTAQLDEVLAQRIIARIRRLVAESSP